MEPSQPSPHESRSADWRTDPTFWFRPDDLPERPRRMSHGVFGNARLAQRDDLTHLLLPRSYACHHFGGSPARE